MIIALLQQPPADAWDWDTVFYSNCIPAIRIRQQSVCLDVLTHIWEYITIYCSVPLAYKWRAGAPFVKSTNMC